MFTYHSSFTLQKWRLISHTAHVYPIVVQTVGYPQYYILWARYREAQHNELLSLTGNNVLYSLVACDPGYDTMTFNGRLSAFP